MKNWEDEFDEILQLVDEDNIGYTNEHRILVRTHNSKIKYVKQFIKDKIKEMADEMIGEEEAPGLTNIRDEHSKILINYKKGYTTHRQHCLKTIKKYI